MGATLAREQTLTTLASEVHLAAPAHGPEDDELRRRLLEILDVLAPSLTWRGITQWFESPSRYLGGERPIDLIAEGRFAEVAEAANAFDQGVYI